MKVICEGCRILQQRPFKSRSIDESGFTDEEKTKACYYAHKNDIIIGIEREEGSRFFVKIMKWKSVNLKRILESIYSGRQMRFGEAFDKAFRHLEAMGGYFGEN